MDKQWSLNELREGIGLTQKQFAKLLGISDKTLWMYEKDSSNIPNKILSKVMYLFDITYDEIFLGAKYDLIAYRRKKVLSRLKEEGLGNEPIDSNKNE